MDFRQVRHITDPDTLRAVRFGFWGRHVKFGPVEECWEWQSNPGRKYGAVSMRRTTALTVTTFDAHRCAWEIAHDVLLEADVQVHHRCENTRCVNPFHLIATTRNEHAAEHPDIAHFIGRAPLEWCVSGKHRMEGENLVVRKTGKRQCRQCILDNDRSKSSFNRGDHKTHCKYGHPFTLDNLVNRASGRRECKICHRERERVRQAKQRARRNAERRV